MEIRERDSERKRNDIDMKRKEERQKKEILDKKRNLRGTKERIVEDWTWEKRRMKWKLKELTRRRKRK